ncbi:MULTISPECIES: NAD(P)/FAD-dependent oxidoreductase [unclassified Brevundimonas]|uniref:NAD(P)/FAD-dependent oxidoreductase n=1 Tax=unclassified Brevundimonas TaxID=2622653 RepID=UPI0014321906|nr:MULTISPECIES: NAD(P)/FAD-dependent oxidoreductase [unclassified Brevundimonas]
MQTADVAIVGAGPAGLTAALYLARYHRRVAVLHDGTSRALRGPMAHNVPGFPDGIAGRALVNLMQRQATEVGAEIFEARIDDISRGPDGFILTAAQDSWTARAVIVATGVDMNEVDLPAEVHQRAIADGVLRYCPICDGYEGTDRVMGVIGCDSNGAAEALFLRQFTSNVTLMPLNWSELTADETAQLKAAGVRVLQGALDRLEPHPDRVVVHLEGGQVVTVDTLYPALGLRPRSELAVRLGAPQGQGDCLAPESPFGAGVEGLWAAGDVVEGLDQITVAMGHGAIAATKAHNWLREQEGHTLRT